MNRQIWRMDAQHELDGAMTYFWHSEAAADREANWLRGRGWHCDVYPETVDEVTLLRLMARPWPVAPLAQLLILAGGSSEDAIAKARADLTAIQQRTDRTPR